ncbi:MAG: hypothetical protein EXQ63_00520 [Ilumatobacteraceae bacterium]|nr:hypothetical protein [Ilumatobacteraceae bacterium]
MFNLSSSEIIFLLILGLVVLGPDRLPGVIRKVGRVYSEVRRMANGFEAEMRETFKEPLEELRGTANTIKHGFGEVDPEPSPPMRPEKAGYAKDSLTSDEQESPLLPDSPKDPDAF